MLSPNVVMFLVGSALAYLAQSADIAAGEVAMAVSVCAQVAATLLGFMLTASAILMTVERTKFMRNMNASGLYDRFFKRMAVACSSFVLLLGFSIAGIFVTAPAMLAAIAFFAGASLVLFVECGIKLYLVAIYNEPHLKNRKLEP